MLVEKSCYGCGRQGVYPRTTYLYAVSAILMSFRRTADGLWCQSCSRRRRVFYSALSLLLGPWGIPWGPIFTVQAVVRNARGGFVEYL